MNTPPEPPYEEYFNRWFVTPFQFLKDKIDGGDGAFVAFSVGLSLCERYHRIETNTQDIWNDYSFKKAAATHLNVSIDLFNDFWDVFRNGIQHQASPKWRSGDGTGRKPYKWAINNDFPSVPTIGTNEQMEEVICINPWGFTQRYISLFTAKPELLKNAVHHSFGHIFESSRIKFPNQK